MKTDPTVAGFIFNNDRLLLIKHKKLGLWLPIGGHIEKDEVPDDAMVREAREEVGLDIKILNEETSPFSGRDEIRQLTLPFYANVHNVGSHWHYCNFYICESPSLQVLINKEELEDAGWFNRREASFRYEGREGVGMVDFAFKKYGEIKNAVG